MRFVKVTCIKNGETYIDLQKVTSMWLDIGNKNTVLRFDGSDHLCVKETPEEILTKLIVIGG